MDNCNHIVPEVEALELWAVLHTDTLVAVRRIGVEVDTPVEADIRSY